jgi:hypothetical protein
MREFSVFAHDPDNVCLLLCEGVDGEEAISVMRWAVCDPKHSWVYAKEGQETVFLHELEEQYHVPSLGRRALQR